MPLADKGESHDLRTIVLICSRGREMWGERKMVKEKDGRWKVNVS